MTGKRQLSRSIQHLDRIKEDTITYVPATLGLAIGGSRKVEVPTRPGYVYARIRGNLSEVVQAYNDTVANVYDLPVLIGRDKVDKTKWYVVGRDLGKYSDWGTSAYLPNHHEQHEFDPNYAGQDIVWIHDRQFLPHLVYPSGSAILVYPHAYFSNDAWSYSGVQMISNVLDYKPTGSNARVVLVYMDGDDDALLLPGSYFDASLTGTADIIDNLPVLPTSTADPIAAVKLLSGTSTVAWNNLYDLRQFHSRGNGGGAVTGSSGHVIQDEGTPLTNRNNLNFIGTNVWAVDDSGNNATKIIISGSAGGSGATTLDELTDVNVPTPASGTSLTYNGSEWIAVQITGSSGGGSVSWDGSFWTPLAKPNTPSAYDDEFDDGSLSGWTEWDEGTAITVSEEEYGLKFAVALAYYGAGIYKAAPTEDFTIFTKLHINADSIDGFTDGFFIGVLFGQDLTNNPATSDVAIAGFMLKADGVDDKKLTLYPFTLILGQYDSTISYDDSSYIIDGLHTDVYLRVRVDRGATTYVSIDYSSDGIAYNEAIAGYSFEYAPAEIGLGIYDNTGNAADIYFSYFRCVSGVQLFQSVSPSGNRIYYKLK